MRENRNQVQAWIGLSEGGFSNHPKDPGGATDRGITQGTFDAWNRMHGRPLRPVRGISKAEAEDIIAFQYMDPIRFDALPSGLDYAMADYAVNSGPSRAVRELQRIVGAQADGVMGAKTLAVVARFGAPDLVLILCERRMAFLRSLKTWATFGKGWKARVMGQLDGAQDNDIGVIDRAARLAAGLTAPVPKPVGVGKALEPLAGHSGNWLAGLLAALIQPFRKLFGG